MAQAAGQTGGRLTGARLRVLDLIRSSQAPLTAYDLLRRLHGDGITAPPVVYRALRYLQDCGLIHRLETLNAYVLCDGPDHRHSGHFIICKVCGRVDEICDDRVDRIIDEWTGRIGFASDRRTVEVLGRCRACIAAATSGAPAPAAPAH